MAMAERRAGRTVRLLDFKGTGSSMELGCLHTNNAIIESSLYP